MSVEGAEAVLSEVIEGLASKLGEDIVVIDIGKVLPVAEHFVLSTGRNRRHVQTLVDEVVFRLKKSRKMLPLSVEGYHGASWVLLDYGDVVVHVFDEVSRELYDLERLWKDAPCRRIEGVTAQPGAQIVAPSDSR